MALVKPGWIVEAERHIGLREVPGVANNPTIVLWLTRLKAWWRDDLTAWCGTYVAECMRAAKLALPTRWYRAKDWLNWGVELAAPTYGCVVVFNRKGGGHVGFVVGRDTLGRLLVLGGNQSDAVNIAPFDMARVAGYRWPSEIKLLRQELPTVAAVGLSSKNEA
ncbi:MAG: TIGR02594 family protein [Methylocystis sp.]|uniref:TIGR02594 family protein n=1 Tax=Methylocystis sp. TaxID=1911079 RepID=UPI003DA5AB84